MQIAEEQQKELSRLLPDGIERSVTVKRAPTSITWAEMFNFVSGHLPDRGQNFALRITAMYWKGGGAPSTFRTVEVTFVPRPLAH